MIYADAHMRFGSMSLSVLVCSHRAASYRVARTGPLIEYPPAEKQKCQVGPENNTACYGQEKKLWVSICLPHTYRSFDSQKN